MKKLILIATIMCSTLWLKAQVFMTEKAKVSFFSETPMENIDATSNSGKSAINMNSHMVFFKITIESFDFQSKLMQEHFNENYMESDKYPFSFFSGKVSDDVDLSKPGTYTVNAVGKLTMHGVTKDYIVPVVIKNEDGKLTVNANFKVKLVDHKIEVPTLVFSKIAESIEVKLSGVFEPAKANASL